MSLFLPYAHGDWRGLASQEFLEAALTPEALGTMGTLIVDRPDRSVRRLEILGAEAYAKTFSPPRNIFKRLFRRPLAFRLLAIHREMLAAGVGCALPYLAAVDRRGRQLFVYRAIPYPGSHLLLREAEGDKADALYAVIAKAIAHLHETGFVHGDCLPGNICLSENNEASFIDNDRTARPFPLFRRHQEMRNLIQFCAHAVGQCGMTPQQRRLFLEQYFTARGESPLRAGPLLGKIEARIQTLQREVARKRKIAR